MDKKRLIEVDFPLLQASLDSVHEKNVRHGHISTLHIWPARRPLAASRAALIATLLTAPDDERERRNLIEKLGGEVGERSKPHKLPDGRTEYQRVEETKGGILHWGRESSPDLDWFRQKILAEYDGRAPRVLDPFAGGGAIPLEAMRMGCEVTAVDINPVAWFILKCTLEYPQRLAGQKLPLPDFALQSREFMEDYFKAHGFKGTALTAKLGEYGLADPTESTNTRQSKKGKVKKDLEANQPELIGASEEIAPMIEEDLAWHVRAWGWWVLQQARKDLGRFYPIIDDKPTVAYLWARTVPCKNCRATVPLLKTRWLCKKEKKRVALTMEANAERNGVVFGILNDVPQPPIKSKLAERREHDKGYGEGTMSSTGVTCPCCNTIMTMQYIRDQAKAGHLSAVMTSVVVDGEKSKEYRLPTSEEILMAEEAAREIQSVFEDIPFGVPDEPLPAKEALGFRAPLYGFDQWYKLFNHRQLLALGVFVKHTRKVREVMREYDYDDGWVEAVNASLAIAIDKLTDYIASLCTWHVSGEKMSHVFVRFALPITWDFAESNPLSRSSGNYNACMEWVALVLNNNLQAGNNAPKPHIIRQSAIEAYSSEFDAIVTDPPYYDAIPYSDLMDFFYVWLRRTLHGLSPEIDAVFQQPLSPKWDHEINDGELIDDSSRFGGNKEVSKKSYEDGMARSFKACHQALKPDGRMVIVFAHKQPDAWETLATALIRAGFVVDGSWPIQTEMGNRTRAISSAALASSVWLVCRKRPDEARPAWDNQVLEEMRTNITEQLRHFWDVGIRGPDFIWAATGPALEAYSKHTIVKKISDGKPMAVTEFLGHARRMVVDFVVKSVLSRGQQSQDLSGLDDVTTYYLLHRNSFKMEDAPIGPCILYAVSCNLSDKLLFGKYDLLQKTGGKTRDEDEEEDEVVISNTEEGTSSTVKLKTWQQRRYAGIDASDHTNTGKVKQLSLAIKESAPPSYASSTQPLIDQVQRLMHLWQEGDVRKVDAYLDTRGLNMNTFFLPVVQSLIELAGTNREERSLLESISNHVASRRALPSRTFDWEEV